MNNHEWDAGKASGVSRCVINGLLVRVWRICGERVWSLQVTCAGCVNYYSSHPTRKAARDAGVTIAKILTEVK